MTQEQFNKADLLDRKIQEAKEIIELALDHKPERVFIQQVFLNMIKNDPVLSYEISKLIDAHVRAKLTELEKEFEAL